MSQPGQAPLFHTPDLAELDRLAGEAAARERTRKQFDDIRWYSVADGVCTFLLTPPYSQRGLFEVRVYSHFNMNHTYIDEKDRQQKLDERGVYCPQWSVPERQWGCPICAALAMLRTVSKQIQAHHPDKDLNKVFQRVEARAYTYFNAVILTAQDPKGNQQLDGGQPLAGPLPRIVKGPPALGDFVLSSLREYGPKMYNPEGAIPLKVERRRTGSNVQDVKYTYQYVPGGVIPLAQNAEGLAAVAANIYDLDRVLNPEKKWTEEEWRRSVAKAQEYIKRWGFAELSIEKYPIFPPDLREAQARAAKKEGGGNDHNGGSARATSPTADLGAVVQANAPTLVATQAFYPPTTAAAVVHPPAPVVPLDLGAMAGGASHPALAPAQPSFTIQQAAAPSIGLVPAGNEQVVLQPAGPIVRDPSRINPTTGAPECKGNFLGTDPACVRCPVLDVCMVETMERTVRTQAQ